MMMGPSLKTTAAVSLAIHIAFFTTTIIIMSNGNHFIRPMPYVVRLVGADAGNLSSIFDKTNTDAQIQQSKNNPKTPSESKTTPSESKTAAVDEAKEYAEYRIAALKAKKKAADAVKLRTTIISLKGSKSSDKTNTDASQSAGGSGGGGLAGGDGMLNKYGDIINAEISKNWAFPEIKGKNFKAVIEVTIMKDGTIIVHGIEKSSGDTLFDSSVLKAIKKTKSVTPPPYEMKKIGLIFNPKEQN